MPTVATHPALQTKGWNPYVSPVLNRSGAEPFVPPPPQAPAAETGGNQFMALGLDQYVPSAQAAPPAADPTRTSIDAYNVTYRVFNNNLNIKLPYASVDLYDRTPQDPMYLEGLDFNLHLKQGQVAVNDVGVSITVGDLLAKQKLPVQVKDVRVVFDPNNQVRVEAKISKFGITVPVKASATVGNTSQGEFKAELGKVSVAGMGVNGLMKTFGISLEKTLKLNDPSKGYWAVGNTVYVAPNKILEQPGISAKIQNVSTHLGDLVVTLGDTPEAAAQAQSVVAQKNLNAIVVNGGHFYYDGYFVKDGKVRLEDKTPDTPLQMEKDGETIMNLRKGFVAVSETRFQGMIAGKLGDDSSLKNAKTSLEPTTSVLKGNMWGFVPLKLDLRFDKTDKGQLMFTPENAKAFGFIPLPDSLIRGQVQKMVDGGVPYGNGVALPSLGDTELGVLKQVKHTQDYLILEAGNEN